MAQEVLLERKKWTALEFLASILEAKTEAKSRKTRSKFDVIFDVRFGRRFFTLGVDFSSILGWFFGVQNEAKTGPNSR